MVTIRHTRTGGSATWVVPHWSADVDRSHHHLGVALSSVFAQTDDDWELVIVDDGSTDRRAVDHLRTVVRRWPDRVHLITNEENRGAGEARNTGVRYAAARRSPFVLFLDADDLARPDRLAVTRSVFSRSDGPGVVYSQFDVIDHAERPVPLERMSGSIAEVVEAHAAGPPEGLDVWIAIGTRTGYVNHTSTTSVRTDVAIAHPFPDERVSEDAHTWLRYSGGGASFAYVDDSLGAYRTTATVEGSASRAREGGKSGFYSAKARVDADGFGAAIRLARARGVVRRDEVPELWAGFRVRLAATLAREGRVDLARTQLDAARTVWPDLERRLGEWSWAGGLLSLPRDEPS